MKTADFDYELPTQNIAQAPAEPRDSCKLLVLDRKTSAIRHLSFSEIGELFNPGDLLVANETRVLPARLLGTKQPSGVAAELLLLKRREDQDPAGFVWECLASPGRRLKPGAQLTFMSQQNDVCLEAEIIAFVEQSRGGRLVFLRPQAGLTLDEAIREAGKVPLPPYITQYEGDPEKYQTVYSVEKERSSAAPTAGLHFTEQLIDSLKAGGVDWACVELQVGLDTFRLVEQDDPREHIMHSEHYWVSQEVVDKIHRCKAAGGRVIAVGTTSVRSLESAWDSNVAAATPPMVARGFEACSDSALLTGQGDLVAQNNATTQLFLMPGSSFHVVDALITNFHVPRSTLMMLVSAFASRDQIMDAYSEALSHNYRFLSFGDAMFIQ